MAGWDPSRVEGRAKRPLTQLPTPVKGLTPRARRGMCVDQNAKSQRRGDVTRNARWLARVGRRAWSTKID